MGAGLSSRPFVIMLLFDIVLQVAEYVQQAQRGTATAASTTSLTDTNNSNADNYFVGGSIFFLSGALANKWAVVTAYATKVFTFATQTSSPGAGAVYSAVGPNYPVQNIVAAVNAALAQMGDVLQVDETATTVASQEEYSLPTGVANVRRVEVAQATSSPYNWKTLSRWDESNGKIIFPSKFAPGLAGYKLRLTYRGQHALVSATSDVISDYVSRDYLIWASRVNTLRDWGNRAHWDTIKPLWEESVAFAEKTRKPAKDIAVVKLSRW